MPIDKWVVLHVAGEAASITGAGAGKLEKGVHVLANDPVEDGVFRLVSVEARWGMSGQFALLHAP